MPAYLSNAAISGECPNYSVPKWHPPASVVTCSSEDVIIIGKPNQDQVDAAEVKVNAANAGIKIPRTPQQAGSTEHYESKVTTPSIFCQQQF